ncbi:MULTISPECIES: hypothetical protein [Vibrio]|uniref:hypothetical protein n=1 Tax=Vibrio TaxID=662 RepID=UPI0005F26536|nr:MULTISPECIES: hypothetical protein [Vibrio]ELP1878779.1 hypothetical protein [Vibrio vulnificus]MCA3912569.1 hypothetical protein [Vibrio vulnificus]MVB91116.1 hypothetical protein [Vibrio cholerae]MVC76789.1 hypothetical protein [Vibrio cholerae]TQO82224.1 hypothetical protein FLM05_19105 [Vibrio cholerae]
MDIADTQSENNVEVETSAEKQKKSDTSDTVLGFVALFIMGAMIYGAWNWAFGDEYLYKRKSEVQSEIITMVGNGADLDSIKHHLTNTFEQEWGLFYRWGNEKSHHYRQDASLLVIFKDLKNAEYLNTSDKKVDIDLISKLINEYQQRNPFDGLEPKQKDLFDNIRLKMGEEHYGIVSSEINKISDELNQKNQLVTQYLSDSKTSLYISIVSLGFGVMFPIVGAVWRRRKTN